VQLGYLLRNQVGRVRVVGRDLTLDAGSLGRDGRWKLGATADDRHRNLEAGALLRSGRWRGLIGRQRADRWADRARQHFSPAQPLAMASPNPRRDPYRRRVAQIRLERRDAAVAGCTTKMQGLARAEPDGDSTVELAGPGRTIDADGCT